MSTTSSRARGRTLRHMETLLSTAALLGATGCKDEKPIDRSWPERHGGDDDGGRRFPSSGSSTSASGGFSSSSGYEVVDPVPMPSRCSTLSASAFRATGVVSPAPRGRLAITVDLEGPRASEPIDFLTAETLTKYADPATVDKLPAKWVLKTVADVSLPAVDLVVNVRCGVESGALEVHVDLRTVAVTVRARNW